MRNMQQESRRDIPQENTWDLCQEFQRQTESSMPELPETEAIARYKERTRMIKMPL